VPALGAFVCAYALSAMRPRRAPHRAHLSVTPAVMARLITGALLLTGASPIVRTSWPAV